MRWYMKILFITPSPPNNLNRIRSKNIIISLSRLGHEITLVTLVKRKEEIASLRLIRKHVVDLIWIKQPIWLSIIQCLIGLFLPIPLRVSYCYSYKLHKELKKQKYQNFNLVYIKRLRMVQYLKRLRNRNNKMFLDLTDSMTKYYYRLKQVSRGFKKLLAIEEYIKHKIYEPKICNKYKNIIMCSEEEINYLVSKFGCNKDNFKVLENGVNLEEWSNKQEIRIGNLNNLIFWGVMNAETNILSCRFFIKKVMPLLLSTFSFTVIGPKPSKSLIKYQSDKIKFKGYIEDIKSNLSNIGIFVCPIVSGAGAKNKIIQAALMNLPIVTTTLGAEGLNIKLKEKFFIANTPKEFVNKINSIVNFKENKLKIILYEQRSIVYQYYDVFKLVKSFNDNFLL